MFWHTYVCLRVFCQSIYIFFHYGVVWVWFIEYMDVNYVDICLIMLGNHIHECVQNLKIKNDFIILSKKVCLYVSTTYSGSYLCFGKQRIWILEMLMAYVCFVTLTYPSDCWYNWDCLFKVIDFFLTIVLSFYVFKISKDDPLIFAEIFTDDI